MYDKKSRYYSLETYEVSDGRGRAVRVVPVPEPPAEERLGVHLREQGQRLDHLAWKYLNDGAGFWRICELNDVMLPESLSEAREVAIPQRARGR
ncbi:MAG: hypothetical protein ACOC5K_00555 [Chloroflexota bacterium]